MEDLDFDPMRIASVPQETLLIFGVRPNPTAIVLTKDSSYDPVRDAKALLFYLSNGLDPVTFQSFCEMIATLYIHNAANSMGSFPPQEPMIKRPKWSNLKKEGGEEKPKRPPKKADEDQEFD